MLGLDEINVIRQKRMDALAAVHLHEDRLVALSQRNKLVDILSFVVPAIYFPIRYLLKGTTLGNSVEPFWEILAGLLSALALLKLSANWQGAAESHNKLIGENISLATYAKQLLMSADTLNKDSLPVFLMWCDSVEKKDRDALGKVSEEERKAAFRNSLKEFSPGSTELCPECGSSPYHFYPGSCQLCGNTPSTKPLS